MNDLRFGLRQLARSPGFTAVAVLTMGLGIGACGAIFSVVNGVLLRPPPYAEPDRLVVMHETARGGGQELPVSGGRHDDLLTQARSFQSIGSYNGGSYVMTGAGAAVHLRALRLSPSVLTTLRVTPVLGRNFLPEEVPEQIDGQRVAILSYGLWQRQFGGRPDVLNQTIQLNGRPATVVGVMPRVSALPGQVDVFTPLLITPVSPGKATPPAPCQAAKASQSRWLHQGPNHLPARNSADRHWASRVAFLRARTRASYV
jgi:hypothetical protein